MAEDKRKKQSKQKQGQQNQPDQVNNPNSRYQKPKDFKKTAIRMFSYMTRHPLLLVLAFVCVIASSLASVGATYLMRPIINTLTELAGQGTDAFPGLIRSVVTLLIVYCVSAICSYCQAAVMAQLAHRGCNTLRRELFERLQELPISFFDQHPHGELMSRFTNDADNVQMALEESVVQLVASVITFVSTVAMMIYLSPPLFLVTLLTLFALSQVFLRLGKKSREYYAQQQKALGQVNGNIQEMIEGLKVVKAFTHEEEAKARFAELNESYRQAATKAGFLSSVLMPVAGNLSNLGYAVTATLGGALTIFGGFDVGGLVIYLNYSKQLAQPLNQISMEMTALLSAMAGAERIFQIMDSQPELDEGNITLVQISKQPDGSILPREDGERTGHWAWKVPQSPLERLADCGDRWQWQIQQPDEERETIRPAAGTVIGQGDEAYELVELRGDVRLINVDFGYVPEKRVLHQVNVYAKPGEKIAFVGSTGAGKTTITNLINRFYEIDQGLILVDGLDIRRISKDALRGAQGAVLQDTHLFTGTVMDNIRYGKLDATDEECIRAAKTANAHSFIRRLPDGYQTMVTGDGANLSQGQRQLLAIARAAVADPPIMVMDEATSSIDTRTEAHISRGMDALMEDRTVFVIAHRLSTVRDANCIAVIEDGRIIEKGPHKDLLDRQGRYYQLYTGQFQLT